MCACICVLVYACLCMSACVCVLVYVCLCTRACVCVLVYALVRARMHLVVREPRVYFRLELHEDVVVGLR